MRLALLATLAVSSLANAQKPITPNEWRKIREPPPITAQLGPNDEEPSFDDLPDPLKAKPKVQKKPKVKLVNKGKQVKQLRAPICQKDADERCLPEALPCFCKGE